MAKIPRALTIAGSDSCGGAGIQADLKTFAALGVHGMSALTAITAQNTKTVTAIQDVQPEIIKAQIEAVIEDIGVDAAKTGMLHTADIIRVVANQVKLHRFPVVVDPVMVAKSGARLLKPEAGKALIELLIPLATVITPNAPEAEAIIGSKVKTVDDAMDAARQLAEMGPKAVVVKGGHIQGEKAIDILYFEGQIHRLEGVKYSVSTTHGTGCSFSAAIAAELAKGNGVVEAVKLAKDFVGKAIRFGVAVGSGHGPVNPLADLYREAERSSALRDVEKGISLLESNPVIVKLAPESQMNLARALDYAEDVTDVAGVPGRIVRIGDRVKASSLPSFGGSGHVARTVLTAMRFEPGRRAGLNVKYSPKVVDICRKLGLSVSYYDRGEEPKEIKEMEGRTTTWGAEMAIKRVGKVPDIIYHEGGWGKEPMITILGSSALQVASLAIEIAKRLEE